MWQGLGLDRHPELLATYFGNYRRVVLLSQRDDADRRDGASAAAERSAWSSSTGVGLGSVTEAGTRSA